MQVGVVRELAASCHHNQPTLTTQKTREVMRDLLECAKNYPLIKIRDITSTPLRAIMSGGEQKPET